MTYKMPDQVVAVICAEFRELNLTDDPMGVAMSAIDKLAKQEGLVDGDGYGIDSEIEAAATEYQGWAERWYSDNPREVTDE